MLSTSRYTRVRVCIVDEIHDKIDDNSGLTIRGTVLQSRHNVLQQRGLGPFGLYWKIIVRYQLTLVAPPTPPSCRCNDASSYIAHTLQPARHYTGRTKGTSSAIVYTIISTRGTGQIRGVIRGINNVRCVVNNVYTTRRTECIIDAFECGGSPMFSPSSRCVITFENWYHWRFQARVFILIIKNITYIEFFSFFANFRNFFEKLNFFKK